MVEGAFANRYASTCTRDLKTGHQNWLGTSAGWERYPAESVEVTAETADLRHCELGGWRPWKRRRVPGSRGDLGPE